MVKGKWVQIPYHSTKKRKKKNMQIQLRDLILEYMKEQGEAVSTKEIIYTFTNTIGYAKRHIEHVLTQLYNDEEIKSPHNGWWYVD